MRYREEKPGEWIRPVMKGYRMQCCDCGLVHILEFRVIRWGRGHKVEWRCWRDNKATKRIRKYKNITVKTT